MLVFLKKYSSYRLPKKKWHKNVVLTVLICAGISTFIPTQKAHAVCLDCNSIINLIDPQVWDQARAELDEHLENEFTRLERYVLEEMWEENILPAMMLATEQFTVVALQQAMIVGMFIDAENQMNTQRTLQEIRARAYKDYHPSVGMCEFGSLMKSIATTEIKGELSAIMLSQRSQDRQLGNAETVGAYGHDIDVGPRIKHFKHLFCNRKDRSETMEPGTNPLTLANIVDNLPNPANNAFSILCANNLAWDDADYDQVARERTNKDIDFFSLVSAPGTMRVNLANDVIYEESDGDDTTYEPDERDDEHILAMSANLFAHQTFPRIPAKLLENKPNMPASNAQKAYLRMRSIVAKRSVAENSFFAIAALKSEGSRIEPENSGDAPDPMNARPYLSFILQDLGVEEEEALILLGDNPSYYAQMEILTKKLYQNPSFYRNLYDKPANVERKATAMQAIKLMQKFDMLKSSLRDEASTSILLELAVVNLQDEIENQIRSIGLRNN